MRSRRSRILRNIPVFAKLEPAKLKRRRTEKYQSMSR